MRPSLVRTQKLMEKMGWSRGKGLGANEDGMKEHIKVDMKSDNRGVGCSKSHADNWIAHQDDFNSLLASLNSDSVSSEMENSTVQSLEKKSKESRGRVHYQKFTRGKDLSGAKGNDLDCIFGRRKNKPPPENNSEESSDASEEKGSAEPETQVLHGVTTVSSGTSVAEYFARRMAEIKSRASGASSQPSADPALDQVDGCDDEPQQQKTRKRKQKKNKAEKDEATVEDSGATVSQLDHEQERDDGKRNKRKKNNLEDEQGACMPEPNSAESGDDQSAKKLKSRKRKNKGTEQDVDCASEDLKKHRTSKELVEDVPENSEQKVREKRKKKKKQLQTADNGVTEPADSCEKDETLKEPIGADKHEKKKKRKVSATNSIEAQEETCSDVKDTTDSQSKTDKKERKKKKKKKTKDDSTDKVTDQTSIQNSHTVSPQSTSKSKKAFDGKGKHQNNKLKCVENAFSGSNLDEVLGYGGGSDIGH